MWRYNTILRSTIIRRAIQILFIFLQEINIGSTIRRTIIIWNNNNVQSNNNNTTIIITANSRVASANKLVQAPGAQDLSQTCRHKYLRVFCLWYVLRCCCWWWWWWHFTTTIHPSIHPSIHCSCCCSCHDNDDEDISISIISISVEKVDESACLLCGAQKKRPGWWRLYCMVVWQ